MYESDIEEYCAYRNKGKSETSKTRKALINMVQILSVNGHAEPDTSDILTYRRQSGTNERSIKQDIVRIEKFFAWKKEQTMNEENTMETMDMFPEEQTESQKPKDKAGRKPISANGEKKSVKFMLYLTPELMGEVRDWCYLKRVSAVSYITSLIEADLHTDDKQDKIAFFRKISAEA